MKRRTMVSLAIAGAIAVVGLGAAAQPALAAGGGSAWSGGARTSGWCQPGECALACDGFVDADGDGSCDNRGDCACAAHAPRDGAGREVRSGRGAGCHGARCRW